MSYVMVYLYHNEVSQLPRCMLSKSKSGSKSLISFCKAAILTAFSSHLVSITSNFLVKPFT